MRDQGMSMTDNASNSVRGVLPPDTASVARPRACTASASTRAIFAASTGTRSALCSNSASVQLMPYSCQLRPSRAIRAILSEGPQLPAM
jgi:hypothetical protein